MNEVLETNQFTFFENTMQFILSKQFWFWHGLVLTIDWFIIAFIAILIKKKYHTKSAKIIHTLLFIFCNLSSLFVNIGAMYKTYINLHRLPVWGILNKSHKLAGLLFSIALIYQFVTGFMSFSGRHKQTHKNHGYVIAYAGMLITISGLALMRHYQKAIIFTILLVLQFLILKDIDPKELFNRLIKNKMNIPEKSYAKEAKSN